MKKRMFFMLLAVFAFIALIGGFKFFQIKAAIAQGSNYQPPPEAVTTVVAQLFGGQPDGTQMARFVPAVAVYDAQEVDRPRMTAVR